MASSSKKIILVSSDKRNFEVEEDVAKMSLPIAHLLEDIPDSYVIPLPNVTSNILSMILEYCKKHVEAAKNEPKIPAEELTLWDNDFVKIDQKTLFDLIVAANYMEIKDLLDLTCQAVADMIKGKTAQEIRQTFDIENDFSPEEEEVIKRESSWAFM